MSSIQFSPQVIVAVIIVFLLVFLFLEKKSRTGEPNSSGAIAPPPSDPPEDDPVPEITIPSHYKNCNLAYHYLDVQLLNLPGLASSYIKADTPLTLVDNGTDIDVYSGNIRIGSLPENRLSDMVRDWNKNSNPYLSFLASYSEDGSEAVIALAFYVNSLERLLSRNPDAKLYKLIGKPDEFSFPDVGSECSVDYDIEKDKYFVMLEGAVLGCLPSSAVKYASERDIDPDDLSVIVGSVDYDSDKGRDIISVYISD